MQCYGKYEDDGLQCDGICNLRDVSCGVCTIVICMGDLNDAENIDGGLYGIGALDIESALLLASVVILGCVSCWGFCNVCCGGSDSWMNRALVNNNDKNMLQVFSNEDPD